VQGKTGLIPSNAVAELDAARQWHEIIGDPTLGDAILDRVVHRAHRIELKGESLRKRNAIATTEGLTNTKEK
jgi:hypothetical protein